MVSIGEHISPCGGIPYLHCSILAGRGDALPIRRPCYRRHNALMPSIPQHVASSGGIPHLYCLILTRRGDTLAIGRPGYTGYYARVALVGVYCAAKAYENISGWDTFDIKRTCCRVICPVSKR